MLLGASALAWFSLSWLVQAWLVPRVRARWGVEGSLVVLPATTVIAGAALAVGASVGSLPLVLAGMTLWVVPRWSIDESARRSALTLVPDQRRARVSFITDLAPVAVGSVLAAPIVLVCQRTGVPMTAPLAACVLAIASLVFALRMRASWSDMQLSWRLRRRIRPITGAVDQTQAP